ncbi:hypothetical protein NMY22_g13531 [Coprinellus aureogranulatus]|nr:hypothetical protein NMY22_g13531 [Coprinellus aureogranulatus]
MTHGVVAGLSEAFPPKATFKVEDIPDLTGKVMIVTGANTGVGKETAKALLAHNAKVYLATRSQEKAEKAIEDLKAEPAKKGSSSSSTWETSSLGSSYQSSQRRLRTHSKEQELHVLFNNAGVMAPPVDLLTTQDYDLQFGTNVLGHFHFTKLLIPALLNGARSSPDGKARVVTTSSSASYMGKLDFDTFKDSPKRRRLAPQTLYNQSKLGNVLISNEFARRYGDQGIVFTSLNPGNLDSELGRHWSKWQIALMRRTILYPVPYGALTQLYAGTTAEGANLNGGRNRTSEEFCIDMQLKPAGSRDQETRRDVADVTLWAQGRSRSEALPLIPSKGLVVPKRVYDFEPAEATHYDRSQTGTRHPPQAFRTAQECAPLSTGAGFKTVIPGAFNLATLGGGGDLGIGPWVGSGRIAVEAARCCGYEGVFYGYLGDGAGFVQFHP